MKHRVILTFRGDSPAEMLVALMAETEADDQQLRALQDSGIRIGVSLAGNPGGRLRWGNGDPLGEEARTDVYGRQLALWRKALRFVRSKLHRPSPRVDEGLSGKISQESGGSRD